MKPPPSSPALRAARHLQHVRYEIRGPLARRADELEREGHDVIKLNIGNLAAFGFRTPETMRIAAIENLSQAEGYCHQKGIFPAREAVVMDTQTQGITGVSADDVFMGNGVSELILMTMEALLEPGDEVLLPAPTIRCGLPASSSPAANRSITLAAPRRVSSPIPRRSRDS